MYNVCAKPIGYVQEKSLVGITNDNPLVEADLMTDLDFCRADGSIPMALNDSKESVLELCLFSSAASLFAAARSNLRAKNVCSMTQELMSSDIKLARSIVDDYERYPIYL